MRLCHKVIHVFRLNKHQVVLVEVQVHVVSSPRTLIDATERGLLV